jgi:hypothetical protein
VYRYRLPIAAMTRGNTAAATRLCEAAAVATGAERMLRRTIVPGASRIRIHMPPLL